MTSFNLFLCSKLLLIPLLIFFSPLSADEPVLPGSARTHQSPPEKQHCLYHPFDVSLPYWRYGGSTVATESLIRLTPNTQSRSGWLFNDFEIQSNDWEVEVHFRVSSDYHIGGDGFAFWVLNGTMHPKNFKEHNILAGPIFGMRENFEGFGVCFDTYDNDGSRDNPRVFVIRNEQSNLTTSWDHDHDFQQNMLKQTPDPDLMHDCTCDYRLKEKVKAILTYRKGILHLYVDTGKGFKSCLTVNIGMETIGMHFAMSALTGQVADIHDVFLITSHYLTEKDAYVDDKRLSQYRDKTEFSFARFFFYFIQFLISCVSLYPLYSEFSYFQQLRSNQIHAAILCQSLNPVLLFGHALHLFQFILLVIGYRWGLFMLHLPIMLWRGYLFMVDTYRLEPLRVRKLETSLFDVGEVPGLVVRTLVTCITLFISLARMFTF